MKKTMWLPVILAAGMALSPVAAARTRHSSDPVPDQVLQWNAEMLQELQAPGAQPATMHPTRTMAITQLAVFDAVNAIERFHGRRFARPRNEAAQAAAAAAAHGALIALLPSQRAELDAFYQQSLAQLGSGGGTEAGIRMGERAAAKVLAARADDGASAPQPPFVPGVGPGEYQLTPPGFSQPVFTQWPGVTPFVLDSASQFRPPPPPDVASARYADDYNAVKSLGELNSTTRSAEQTTIGRFWGAAPVQNVWNQIAEMAGSAFGNTLEQNARMFAVLDAGLADGVIALYDAKYAYHRWRPVTAVRAGDTDLNPGTSGDPGWTPLANTAPDPSYPGAHAEISESAATILRDFFGTDRFVFGLTTPSLPGVVRTFASFSQAADEASVSRIYAGQHFGYDEDAGQALGAQVGDFVADHFRGR
jgi:hypothetical protein